MSRRAFGVLLTSALVVAAACGSDDDGDDSATGDDAVPEGTTIRVPDDHETIQEAVDAAEPGDLILVEPGVYEEAVDVTTDMLTIRGLDRNEVILDGGFELDNGIRVTGADGVAIENMTARNYTRNGFFWTGVEGYRGSYLTTYRTGDYGIYAFDSTKGLIEHSYASGSPDAGIYIGQCYPCDAVIDDVVSEYNGLGYSGTNSGGNLLIVNSTFRYNRAGIVPNSGSYELCYPERETTIVGNVVHSNNQPDTPAIDVALLAMGNGILVAGGVNNTIERNLVYDHDLTGIGLVPFPEDDPNDDIPPPEDDERPCEETLDDELADASAQPADLEPAGNRVVGNVVEDSLADLAVGSLEDVSALGNCFADNTFAPAHRRRSDAGPLRGRGPRRLVRGRSRPRGLIAEHPPSGDYRDAPVPEPQENMPDAETAPARPAVGLAGDRPRRHRGARAAVTAPPGPLAGGGRRPGPRGRVRRPRWHDTPPAVPPPGRCGCRPPTPGRRGGCRSSSSSAPSATRRPTTRSCTPAQRPVAPACSSATRPRTPTRRPRAWPRATRPATRSSTWPRTGRPPSTTTASWSSRSPRSPTTGRASASTPGTSGPTRSA